MKILYLGAADGTSRHRADALRRLGHDVLHLDFERMFGRYAEAIGWRADARWLLTPLVVRALAKRIGDGRFDLGHVDQGTWFGPSAVSWLRSRCERLSYYSPDDPFGTRDRARFAQARRALPLYDLVTVPRESTRQAALRSGLGNVLRVHFAADEVAHRPRVLDAHLRLQWQSDLSFVGTFMEDRDEFLLALSERGISLAIRGSGWCRSRRFDELSRWYRGPAIEGDDYACAIQAAAGSLCLLSSGNGDLHTTRSLEIPALGGLLIAPRTTEHLEMYEDRKEALFFDSIGECAEVCTWVLSNRAEAARIAVRGRARFERSTYRNEALMAAIVERCRDVRPQGGA